MKKKIFYIVLTMVVSSAVVVGLFLSSEHIMKRENPFVRRFLPHPVSDLKTTELSLLVITIGTMYISLKENIKL